MPAATEPHGVNMAQRDTPRTRNWQSIWRCLVGVLVAVVWTSTPSLVLAADKAPDRASKRRWGKLVSSKDKKVYWLAGDKVTIGSSPRATVVLAHSTVSAKHAELTHKNGVVFIQDAGSQFGTLVAGTSLKKGRKMQLFQRTVLSLGAIDLTFDWGDRGKVIAPLRKSRKPPPKKKAKKATTKKAAPAKAKAAAKKRAGK